MWRINTSQILLAKTSDRRFIERFDEAQRTLSNPDFVRAVCIHEAAHQIYWARIGIETTPNYNVELQYDSHTDKFIIIYASMVLISDSAGLETTVSALAQAHASGGAAVEALTLSEAEYGDEADFNSFCSDLKVGVLSHRVDFQKEWMTARDAVKRELQDKKSAVRAELLRRARDFEIGFRAHSQLA